MGKAGSGERCAAIVMKRIIGIFSSITFLMWIAGSWIAFYVLTAIWTREAFALFVAGVGGNTFFKIPFVLFLVSGYCNLIRLSGEALKNRRILYILRFVLPLGVMLFFTGFFLSLSTKQFKWIVVGEGESMQLPWSDQRYMVTSIKPGLRTSFLDIEEEGAGIFAYEPKVILTDRSSQLYEVGAFPPTRIGSTYYHILNFGLAPGVRISDEIKVRKEGYMPLRLLPPGNDDFFEIAPYPYRFLINLEPEKVVWKGKRAASQFSIAPPRYRVRVFKGEKVIAEAVSKEKITFDNFTLSFFEHAYWVQIEVVKDAGALIMLTGILFMCIGVPLYVLYFSIQFIYNNRISWPAGS
jgi:hypothetical protein